MDDQKIRLALEILGASDVAELNAQVKAMRTSFAEVAPAMTRAEQDTYELADAYEVLGQETTTVFTSASQIPQGFSWTKFVDAEVARLNESLGTTTSLAGQLGPATGQAARGTADLGNAALQASRGIEDMQYGFNGVVNNIPGIVMALGGTAGLTATISLLAVGANILVNHWSDLTNLFATKNPFPDATASLESMQKALGKNGDALEKLRQKTSLSNTELAEFNRLTKEGVDLSARIAQAKETETNAQKFGADQDEATVARGKGIGQAVLDSGGYQAVIDRFTQARAQRIGGASESETAAIRKAFQESLNAALKGDEGQISALSYEAKLDKTGVTGMFDRMVERTSPQAKKREKDKAALKKEQDALDQEAAANESAYDKKVADKKTKDSDALKKEQDALDQEAAANISKHDADVAKKKTADEKKATEAEAKRIVGTVGQSWQGKYEQDVAMNNASRANGMPSMGDAQLKASLQAQMFDALKRHGAGDAAAKEAVQHITGKGDMDLGKRAADAAGSNLSIAQQTLQISNELIDQYEKMSQIQRVMDQQAKSQMARLKSGVRSQGNIGN